MYFTVVESLESCTGQIISKPKPKFYLQFEVIRNLIRTREKNFIDPETRPKLQAQNVDRNFTLNRPEIVQN